MPLCQEDSDGDGLTNGAELGDPCCVWKFGFVPFRTQGITDPANPFDVGPLGTPDCTMTTPQKFSYFCSGTPVCSVQCGNGKLPQICIGS